MMTTDLISVTKNLLESYGLTIVSTSSLEIEAQAKSGHRMIVAYTPQEIELFSEDDARRRVSMGLLSLRNAYRGTAA